MSKRVHRVFLNYSEEAYRQLNELKPRENPGSFLSKFAHKLFRSSKHSSTSTIRNALGFYSWYSDVKKSGGEIIVRNSDGICNSVNFK